MERKPSIRFVLICILFVVLLLFLVLPVSAEIVINEVELNPEGGDSGNEWVEIFSDEAPINLEDWYIQDKDGNNFSFPNVVIKDFYVLDSLPGFALVNSDEEIKFFDEFGFLVDETGAISDNSDDNDTWSRLPDGFGDFAFKEGSKNFPNRENVVGNKSISYECLLENDEVVLNVQVSSYCVDEVIFSVFIDGEWMNFTGIDVDDRNYSYTLDLDLFNDTGFVDWTVFLIDCFNRTEKNGMEEFYVNQLTSLTVIPDEPDGLNGWYVTEPKFILANPDALELFYRWDSTGVHTFSSPFDLEDIPNAPPKESAGILDLNYWSDACDEEAQTKIINVDLKNPEVVDLFPENNSVVFDTLRPEISFYLDDVYQANSGIDIEIVQMSLNGVDVTSQINLTKVGIDAIVKFKPDIDLPEGMNRVTVNVTDNAGRSSNLEWFFSVNETEAFDLFVHSPENLLYDNRRVVFNITTSKIVKEIGYVNHNDRVPRYRRLCRECDEYGQIRSRTRTYSDGENNVTIRAMDEFGNVNEQNLSFVVDSRAPKISRTSPSRNDVVNGSDFSVRYSETNLESVRLFWNPNVSFANCSSGTNQECRASVDLSEYDGEVINYYFEVSDAISTTRSRAVSILVDTSSPNLTLNFPENVTYDGRVPFNVTVSEEVTIEYLDNSTSRPRWRRLCSRCDEYGESRTRLKRFREGIYNLLIRATDEAGNSDVKEIEFIVV